ESFTLIMQHAMVTMQKNSHVDRILDFVAKFAVSLGAGDKANNTLVEQKDAAARSVPDENTDPNASSTAPPPPPSESTLMDQSEMGTSPENEFLNKLIQFLIDVSSQM